MPDPIRQINLVQFAHLLAAAKLTRKVVYVHLHHTWRPRRQDFRGLATIEAMRRYHVDVNGWSDIAQHLTIDPNGEIWTGRNWNLPPASAVGFNGTSKEGPFMIEMVGDFDAGQDPFDGPQRAAAVEVVARLIDRFELDIVDALKLHRELKSPKSCPGTGIDHEKFAADVTAFRQQPSAAPRGAKKRAPRAGKKGAEMKELFASQHLAGFATTRALTSEPEDLGTEVHETETAGKKIEAMVHERTAARQRVRSFSVGRDGDDPQWAVLKPHVVNLSRGELSEGGTFSTTPEDLDAIVEAIRVYAQGNDSPHVLLYAHGGLVDERSALAYAKAMHRWWLHHGVYPVFFVWETALLETLAQFIIGPRDLADWTSDLAIEALAKGPGSLVWGGMKESARLASSTDAGSGYQGGALLFAKKLAKLFADDPAVAAVHAVGHSAGSIFHAHLLPALLGLNVRMTTTAFLAPAVRTDLFKDKLLQLALTGKLGDLSMFTMQEEAERQDDCFKVYRKSLLYLVSRSFEGVLGKPILGLQQSVRRDAELAALFGVKPDGTVDPALNPLGELQLSFPLGHQPNPLTRALRHGDFDNDKFTMSSVLRRILNVDDELHLGEDDFPFALEPRLLERAAAPPMTATPAVVISAAPAPNSGGRRVALCVGIDSYPDRPLAGCVSDARAWAATFQQMGFEVRSLIDTQATREAIVSEMTSLVSGAAPGDVLAFQYAGHGTQVPDDDGDEVDRFDEAWVPIDYGQGRLLLDDDVGAILSRLAPGAALTLFMDCCHSGTNSRFAPLTAARSTSSERARFLPASAELVEAHRVFRRTLRSSSAARAIDESLPGVVHFAACLDNEYSWEFQGHGDYTTAATKLLAEAVARGDTNEAFAEATRQALAARGRQHPQLMRLPDTMSGRRLLSPFGDSAGRAFTALEALTAPSPTDGRSHSATGDAIAHLEAAVRLLRAERW
jgi:hypothetical protein